MTIIAPKVLLQTCGTNSNRKGSFIFYTFWMVSLRA